MSLGDRMAEGCCLGATQTLTLTSEHWPHESHSQLLWASVPTFALRNVTACLEWSSCYQGKPQEGQDPQRS